ncbi:MAG: hypothetical protein QM733_04470 [Ilumatobacteraceae bacterium]
MEALATAADAARRRLGGRAEGWRGIAWITNGHLLASPSPT